MCSPQHRVYYIVYAQRMFFLPTLKPHHPQDWMGADLSSVLETCLMVMVEVEMQLCPIMTFHI